MPLGRLVNAKAFAEEVRSVKKLVTVGDYCTLQALNAGAEPKVAVIDLAVERRPDGSILEQSLLEEAQVLKVESPAGQITPPLWEALETAFGAVGPCVIQVKGEEDLAALPAIALAPKDYTVVYGQPKEGAVFVDTAEESKSKVTSILDRMEVMDGD